ncbi:uncharacterized protein LOC127789693 [Diospyros lotus]|uniref:uncharacterized protein LOC127789693 n=1 Tax=Diospyros lotus TaxID=55363 RepID=UPI0022592092|nr:uncharacterized protein LOC127789693 [Diospyros lotus]
MVHGRVNSFVLGLVFIFLALRNSAAHTHKDTQQKMVASRENFNAEATVVEASKKKLGGRKMGSGRKEELRMMNGSAGKVDGNLLRGTSAHAHHHRHLHPVTLMTEIESFKIFSADYHMPKPHPPKHN